MLRAYSKDISVNSDNAIPFNIDKFDVGNNISHQAGSSNIIVRAPRILRNKSGYFIYYCRS